MKYCSICGGSIPPGMYSISLPDGRIVCDNCIPLMVQLGDKVFKLVLEEKEGSHDDRRYRSVSQRFRA